MHILYDSNVLVVTLARREAIIALKAQINDGSVVHVTSRHMLGEVEVVLFEKMGLTKQKARVVT